MWCVRLQRSSSVTGYCGRCGSRLCWSECRGIHRSSAWNVDSAHLTPDVPSCARAPMTDRKQALIEACAEYGQLGLTPFVLCPGAKKPPPGTKWKDCIIKPGQAPNKVSAGSNIAILLGAPS